MCSIFLTSFPSPVLQPLTNTNLRILQPDASAVDLGHRNHQGSDGFGYLFLLVCLLPVYSNIPRCTICLKYAINEKACSENTVSDKKCKQEGWQIRRVPAY